MTNPKFANKSDFVWRGRNEVRRAFGAQNFDRVRIESNNNGRSVFGMGMPS